MNSSGNISKSYYMSTKLQLAPIDAIKVCHSMDMILASPQNQLEFDNLKDLLRNVTFEWENAAISGYKSESQNEWLDSGEKLNYEINWGRGEPNDAKTNEYCLYMQTKDGISVNDDPCSGVDFPFICEYTRERLSKVNQDDAETSRFLRKIASKTESDNLSDNQTETEYFLSDENLSLSWIDAETLCNSLGMDIFTPTSASIIEMIMEHLSTKCVFTGYTNIGSEASDKFYSINDGKELNSPLYFDSKSDGVLILEKHGDSYRLAETEISSRHGSVVCEKSFPVKDKTEQFQIIETENAVYNDTNPQTESKNCAKKGFLVSKFSISNS